MSQSEAIQVAVGKSFSVNLYSNLGSTNYGWILTQLPAKLGLFGQNNEPLNSYVGGTVLQQFHFLALAEDKVIPTKGAEDKMARVKGAEAKAAPVKGAGNKVNLKFKLLNLCDPTDCADEADIVVEFIDLVAGKAAIDKSKFYDYSENSVSYSGQEACGPVFDPLTSNIIPMYALKRPAQSNLCPTPEYGISSRSFRNDQAYPMYGVRRPGDFLCPPVSAIYAMQPPVSNDYAQYNLKYGITNCMPPYGFYGRNGNVDPSQYGLRYGFIGCPRSYDVPTVRYGMYRQAMGDPEC